ncbi:MAG TPA: DedA family protein/thiosulfate sulfurtransferase GlpE [Polyangia bacterium]|nr:DedA family protein/thiosulfate sulfurtransferase GlpE [Polyangia bacterium]
MNLVSVIADQGLLLVFANVLLQQLGVPIPAEPTLVVAGSLAARGLLPLPGLVGVTWLAVMIADSTWYWMGRRYGNQVLRVVCRLALSPDSCVRNTEQTFTRWGLKSVAVAKFIPGFSMVAPPLAGAMRVSWGSFLLFDLLAAVLWSSVGIGAGLIFYRQVDRVLAALAGLGGWAPVVGVILLAVFVGGKWVQRRRFYRSLRMARISVDELKRLIDLGAKPVVFDVRSVTARARDSQRIPGAIAFDPSQVDAAVAELPDEREVILYCNCPSEASAARIARLLMDRGVRSVRPLAGGLQAWLDAGFAADIG